MFRKLVCLTLLLSLSCGVKALGFRAVVVGSALSEPLDARIGLVSVDPAEIDELSVSLADSAAFEKAGLERPAMLTRLRFEPKVGKQGGVYIQVSTRNGVREPYLNFLLEVTWKGTTLLREYAILLDPRDNRPVNVSPAARGRQTDQNDSAPVVRFDQSGQQYGPVRHAETLWVIAKRVRPDSSITVEQMMMALQRSNPDAFRRGNVNLLKRGATLEIPGREFIAQLSAREARRAFVQQNDDWRSLKNKGTGTPTGGAAVRQADTKQFQEPLPDSSQVAASSEKLPDADTRSAPADQSAVRRGAEIPVDEPNLRVLEPESVAAPGLDGRPEQEPSTEEKQLREEIANSRHDLIAVREINRDLAELKVALEERVRALRKSLEERDRIIDQLEKRLQKAVPTFEIGSDRGGPEAVKEGVKAVPGGISSQLDVGRTQEDEDAGSPEPPVQQRPAELGDLSWFVDHWLPLLVVALVMLLLLLVVVVRRRQTRSGLPDPDAFGSYIDIDDQFDNAVLEMQDETRPSRTSQQEPSMNNDSDGDISSKAGADVASALTEADIYLAYRRYSQAEALIREAIRNAPDNMILRAKLLEIYAFREDKKHFTSSMEEAYTKMSSREPEIWAKVVEMGRSLIPEHRLIAGTMLPEEQSEELAADFPIALEDIDLTLNDNPEGTQKNPDGR